MRSRREKKLVEEFKKLIEEMEKSVENNSD